MSLNQGSAASKLLQMEPLRKPVMQAIIASADLQEGSRGLDVGCGIGLHTLLLAKAVGLSGHITGIDLSTPHLLIAKEIAQQTGMTDRVSFLPGTWECIPFQEKTFDWIWSMDAAGYAPGEPVSAICELVRVLKPGGGLIIGYWSSQCLLPGYPALEARLNASRAGIAPFQNGSSPAAHYLYTLDWMQQAGLVNARAETFAQTVSAPLSPDMREALAELLAMRWSMAEPDVSAEDWQTYQRLCRAESPEYILDRPGYSAFFTYSVFYGSAPEK